MKTKSIKKIGNNELSETICVLSEAYQMLKYDYSHCDNSVTNSVINKIKTDLDKLMCEKDFREENGILL